MSTNTKASKILRIVLMVVGCGLMVATIPVFFPVSWMQAGHEWLGLGRFPAQPITIYLARSTSLLYAVHGFLMFYVGWNLDRYLPLATIFGFLHVAIGLTMLGIDLTTPMPWCWTAVEGVPIALVGALIVWLARLARDRNVQ